MSRKLKELTGMTFGKLTAIKREGSNKHGDALWICQCECGNKKIVPSRYLLAGETKSCGCYTFRYPGMGKWKKGDRKGEDNPNYKHGKSCHRLYTVYANMKQRCFNPKVPEYNCYGGRGITICKEWLNSFESFFEWAIKNGYEEGLSIDRIDNDGNYEPSNCQWITRSENSKKIAFDREKKKQKENTR
jgi:hypothetical protein